MCDDFSIFSIFCVFAVYFAFVSNFGKHPVVFSNFVNFFEDEKILKITFFRCDLRFASWDLATFKKALDPLWSNVGVLDFWVVCNIYRQTSMKLSGYFLSEGFLFPSIKFHIFWEGHKILQNLHRIFDHYCYMDKSKVEILQIFLAFSECMNVN